MDKKGTEQLFIQRLKNSSMIILHIHHLAKPRWQARR